MSTITLTVNGTRRQVEKKITAQELLSFFKQRPEMVIIEHNQKIFKGNEWTESIQEGDVIEIVQFMGGGA